MSNNKTIRSDVLHPEIDRFRQSHAGTCQ
jgi:hypothetical protein